MGVWLVGWRGGRWPCAGSFFPKHATPPPTQVLADPPAIGRAAGPSRHARQAAGLSADDGKPAGAAAAGAHESVCGVGEAGACWGHTCTRVRERVCVRGVVRGRGGGGGFWCCSRCTCRPACVVGPFPCIIPPASPPLCIAMRVLDTSRKKEHLRKNRRNDSMRQQNSDEGQMGPVPPLALSSLIAWPGGRG
jgi:hypothetical protein